MTEDHYCVRWKGFHTNIVSALGDLKSDEEFVDVTLSCEGKTLQGHKVILSASSPYFRKILKDNPCRHPVLILNDIQVDILEAIMTYMYHGTVSVPHHKLQMFLKTADALRIKGIVDCFAENRDSAAANTQESEGLVCVEDGAEPQGDLPLLQHPLHPMQHPAGDLSLLASAATELDTAAPATVAASLAAAAVSVDSAAVSATTAAVAAPLNPKRRKTLPRKLGSYMSSPARSAFSSGDEEVLAETEKENQQSLLSLALTHKETSGMVNLKTFLPALNFLNGDPANIHKVERDISVKSEDDNGDQDDNERSTAINLSTHKSLAALYSQQLKQEIKPEESLDLSVKSGAYPPSSLPVPCSVSSAFSLLPAHLLNGSAGGGQFNLMSVEGGAAEQMAAILGPEQMAALLGPSWKSRQPRMCQYCNRMFSNKFNLKQHILNMHTVGREMSCEICNKKVKNKWYLRRHHVTHHGAPLKK